MKRILIALAITGMSFLVQAETPTPESIEELLTLTQAEKLLDSIKPQVKVSMKAGMDMALKGRTPSAAEQKVLDDYLSKSASIMNEDLTMDRLKPLYVEQYAKYFSQEEVDALIVFYKTPAGMSLITKMPQLMQGLMAAMPTLMVPMMEKIKAASKQMASELEALKKNAPKEEK